MIPSKSLQLAYAKYATLVRTVGTNLDLYESTANRPLGVGKRYGNRHRLPGGKASEMIRPNVQYCSVSAIAKTFQNFHSVALC